MHINQNEFLELIQNNEKVIIDFWAPWCGPCMNFGPVFEKVAESYDDIIFAKMDIDDNEEFAANNSIRSIPTIWMVKDGETIFNKPGAYDLDTFKQLIDAAF